MCFATISTAATKPEVAPAPDTVIKNNFQEKSSSQKCKSSFEEESDSKRKTVTKCTSSPVSKKKRTPRRVRFVPPTTSDEEGSSSSAQDLNRSVRADVVSTHKPASAMTEDEISKVHWQPKDYEFFRGTARLIASEILNLSSKQKKSSRSYDNVLSRSYEECAAISAERTAAILDKTSIRDGPSVEKDDLELGSRSEEKLSISPQLFEKLTQWVRAGHSRRGLEKFCVMHHIEARPVAKQTTIHAVLAAQQVLKLCRDESFSEEERRSSLENLGVPRQITSLPDEEILRVISEQFTRTSKLYAMTMGHADAAALGLYNHEESTQRDST